MTDINDTDLRAPDPIEWDTYDTGSKGGPFVLAPKGVYQVVEKGTPVKGATAEGYLQFDLGDLAIIAPGAPWDGQTIRFTRVNTKKWPNRNGSSIGDYLKSKGYMGTPQTNEGYTEAITALAGRPFFVRVDWEARDKTTGFKLKGYDTFPTKDDGSKASVFTHVVDGQEIKLYANLQVRAFVPPPAK